MTMSLIAGVAAFVLTVLAMPHFITYYKIKKIDKVLIKKPTDVTEHFRDPQIFDYKGQFMTIIGAQNHNKQGFIKFLQSS